MTLSDFQDGVIDLSRDFESINMMVYGDSSVGKTWLAGTCPGRCFWLIGEPGYKSAARAGAIGKGRRIGSTSAALAAVDWLRARDRYTRYDWIILDGFTTMQDRFRLGYAAEAFDINPSKRQHRNLPDRPDYFNTQNFVKGWIPDLIDLPVNLLITAHAYRTDETDEDMYVYPGIQGKVTETANAISGLLDAVGYLSLREIEDKASGTSHQVRRLLWQRAVRKGVTYYAGDKFDALGKFMDNPTMPEIIAKINGEGN